jgi:hypothetical protein
MDMRADVHIERLTGMSVPDALRDAGRRGHTPESVAPEWQVSAVTVRNLMRRYGFAVRRSIVELEETDGAEVVGSRAGSGRRREVAAGA